MLHAFGLIGRHWANPDCIQTHPTRAQPELRSVHSSVVNREAPGDNIWMNAL